MRVAYLLNIVWWRQPYAAPAQLLLGDKAFPLKVPFGVIRVITIAGDWAIMPDNFDVDVMAANPNGNGVEFAIQADRPSRFTLFHREQAGRIHVCKNDETVSLRPAGKGVWQFVAPPGSINVSAMR
jgi:hypothetical protein